MREIDRRIAVLRLRIAEIDSREDQLKTLRRQFRNQLDRIVDFAVYQNADLDTTLSMAGDVETRLANTEMTLRHLAMIRIQAQQELEALHLTRSIEQAKTELTELEARAARLEAELRSPEEEQPGSVASTQGSPGELPEVHDQQAALEQEIKRLKQHIALASDEAARAVSSRVRGSQSEAEGSHR